MSSEHPSTLTLLEQKYQEGKTNEKNEECQEDEGDNKGHIKE